MERALIEDYRQSITELLGGLNRDNLTLAVEIAQVPEHIRGYGHVKLGNVDKARRRWEELRTMWRAPIDTRAVA